MSSQVENSAVIEEDEIDLRELWKTIVSAKKFIALFTVIVTTVVLIMQLAKPNIYESETILVSQSSGGSKSMGGLGALAGLAGVNIGGGGGSDLPPFTYIDIILKDYSFNVMMIEKYKLQNMLEKENENLVFAFGLSTVHDIFSSAPSDEPVELVDTYKQLMEMLTLSEDSKSGTITFSVKSPNRTLTKELLNLYLEEMTKYYRQMDMSEVAKQLEYYQVALVSTDDIQLKTELSGLISSLVQKKVLSKASKYYMFKQLTQPRASEIKEKVAPKRGLVIVVAFITSIILSIFIVFFREFLKKDDEAEIA